MINILCKSKLVSHDLADILANKTKFALFHDEQEFSKEFRKNLVDIVIYEPDFIENLNSYRKINSHTSFIVLASPGDEPKVEKALCSGACAILYKPFRIEQFQEVLAFVSF